MKHVSIGGWLEHTMAFSLVDWTTKRKGTIWRKGTRKGMERMKIWAKKNGPRKMCTRIQSSRFSSRNRRQRYDAIRIVSSR